MDTTHDNYHDPSHQLFDIAPFHVLYSPRRPRIEFPLGDALPLDAQEPARPDLVVRRAHATEQRLPRLRVHGPLDEFRQRRLSACVRVLAGVVRFLRERYGAHLFPEPPCLIRFDERPQVRDSLAHGRIIERRVLDRGLREERVECGRGDGLEVFGDDEGEEGRCAAVLREVGVGVGHGERAEGEWIAGLDSRGSID